MVFDYMDHDMTGLMERKGYKFKPEQARCLYIFWECHSCRLNECVSLVVWASL